MKSKNLFLLIPLIVLIMSILPVSFLNAAPDNIVVNGDFEDLDPEFDGWDRGTELSGSCDLGGDASNHYAILSTDGSGGVGHWVMLFQDINSIPAKDLDLSYRVWLKSYDSNEPGLQAYLALYFIKNSINVGEIKDNFNTLHGNWQTVKYNISQRFNGDFDRIDVFMYLEDANPDDDATNLEIWFDDISLSKHIDTTSTPTWVRTMPMTCYSVWINKDGNFQFVFWYPYKNNNWVKIYDMDGKLVYEINLPYSNPNLIVELPDGNYTVKTFHNNMSTPIQEFIIGKP